MGAGAFLLPNEINELSRPEFEPRFLRPQRYVLTTRRSGPSIIVCVLVTLNFSFYFLMWLMSLVLSLCGFGEAYLSIGFCSFSLIGIS